MCLDHQPEHEKRRIVVMHLTGELENFEEIVKHLIPPPGEIPRINGLDIFGGSLAFQGTAGGDHVIFVDFTQRFDLESRIQRSIEQGRHDIAKNLRRCQTTAGIAVLDVSGHRMTDAFMAAMLHQAFLVGAAYELDMFGHVTRQLFENLNTRFYQSSSEHKYVSLIYGEISEDSVFRFLSAAQPFPSVFSSQHDRFMEVSDELCIKDDYTINEWLLMGSGDILLLHTDGLTEHHGTDGNYYPMRLEDTLRQVKHLSAVEIFEAVRTDLLRFSRPADDISFVVIKRT
jgi:serine phosphatase RsbU (regulator of sigma subunit)